MVLGSMPMKQRAPSSAKPTGEHGLLSFSNLSRGSKGQNLVLRRYYLSVVGEVFEYFCPEFPAKTGVVAEKSGMQSRAIVIRIDLFADYKLFRLFTRQTLHQ